MARRKLNELLAGRAYTSISLLLITLGGLALFIIGFVSLIQVGGHLDVLGSMWLYVLLAFVGLALLSLVPKFGKLILPVAMGAFMFGVIAFVLWVSGIPTLTGILLPGT